MRKLFTKQTVVYFGLSLLLCYLIAPLLAGMMGYSDPRGPIVYPQHIHRLIQGIGETLASKPRAITPMAERPLFYGVKGKEISKDEMKKRLERLAEE